MEEENELSWSREMEVSRHWVLLFSTRDKFFLLLSFSFYEMLDGGKEEGEHRSLLCFLLLCAADEILLLMLGEIPI